jgi:hypothetical protein
MNLIYSPVTGHRYERSDMTAEKHREMYPVESWAYNPWTGEVRDAYDVKTDPQGLLIVAPGEELTAAEARINDILHPHPEKVWTAVPPTPEPQGQLANILAERGKRYGKFADHAKITQDLKDVMHACPKWAALTPSQKEALEMVAHKIGRILNGDPNYDDSWVDVAGYSKLVADELQGVER